MTKIIPLTILFLTLSAASGSASEDKEINNFSATKNESEEDINCRLSVEDLEKFLAQQPHACKTTDDCEGYYILPSKGALLPVVLPKTSITDEFTTQLKEYTEVLAKNCDKLWPRMPASPYPYNAECKENVCVNTASP